MTVDSASLRASPHARYDTFGIFRQGRVFRDRRLPAPAALLFVVAFLSLAAARCSPPPQTPLTFWSDHLDHEIAVLPGVFFPDQATRRVLPLMEDNAELFRGGSVLDIGTGSGIIGLYAASHGAERVVATDINPAALKSTRRNAADLGFADVIETRLVPENDISAYSVVKPGERFDVIISNPPYALDLDAVANTYATDRGDLGFSIVRGLERHLSANGVVILLYGSNFYHNVMVKFARYMGYEVRHHNPIGLNSREAETLFNAYLARLLEHEGIEPHAFRFDRHEDVGLNDRFLRNLGLNTRRLDCEPLFAGPGAGRCHPGIIVIEHGAQTAGGG